MKKYVKVDFYLIIVIVIALLYLAADIHLRLVKLNDTKEELKAGIEEVYDRGSEEIGIEGFQVLANGAGYGLLTLGQIFVEIILVIVPCCIAAVFFVLALLARIIYTGEKGNLIVYRIIMSIEYILLCLFALAQLVVVINNTKYIGSFIITLLAFLYVVATIGIGIRNTFFKLKKQPEVMEEQINRA